jgi:hypothetical protein
MPNNKVVIPRQSRSRMPGRMKSWGKCHPDDFYQNGQVTETILESQTGFSPSPASSITSESKPIDVRSDCQSEYNAPVPSTPPPGEFREKRRPSFASSIRKSFSFSRTSTEVSRPSSPVSSATLTKKDKGLLAPVIQSLRQRAAGHRSSLSQFFFSKKKNDIVLVDE